MSNNKNINKMRKGDTFTITHSDGKVINETVYKVETEREKKEVNRYHHRLINVVIDTYYEVKRNTYIICESGAVYEPHEIN